MHASAAYVLGAATTAILTATHASVGIWMLAGLAGCAVMAAMPEARIQAARDKRAQARLREQARQERAEARSLAHRTPARCTGPTLAEMATYHHEARPEDFLADCQRY